MRRGTADISRTDYFRIIDLKTAELFRVSCQLGASLGGYGEPFAQAAAIYGRQLGIAYQIYDDLADFFGEERKIGKTLGTDLVSGKLTLPLLELQTALPEAESAALVAEITGRSRPDMDLRLAQLREYKVFETVAAEIERQLQRGEAEMARFAELPPVPRLLALGSTLRTQVDLLKAKG